VPGTDDRRYEDRREEDVRLAAMLEELSHNFAPSDHSHKEINRLIEVLEGKPHYMPSGRTNYEGGLINEVAQLTESMRKGGLLVNLPRWTKVLGFFLVLFQIILTVILITAAIDGAAIG
jgi:hypothetical protein